MDQFINTLDRILGPASRLTLHSSIGDFPGVLLGLGILALVAIVLLLQEAKPYALKRWHAVRHGGHPVQHRWMRHRH
jgi:hypothetical protein